MRATFSIKISNYQDITLRNDFFNQNGMLQKTQPKYD